MVDPLGLRSVGRKQYFVIKSRVGHRSKSFQWKKKKGVEWITDL